MWKRRLAVIPSPGCFVGFAAPEGLWAEAERITNPRYGLLK
jgi:hypothetical protein